jgi:hypothetical protein
VCQHCTCWHVILYPQFIGCGNTGDWSWQFKCPWRSQKKLRNIIVASMRVAFLPFYLSERILILTVHIRKESNVINYQLKYLKYLQNRRQRVILPVTA